MARRLLPPCRAVTEEEVRHFRECGWVKLSAFVPPSLVAFLRRRAVELMGEDAQSNPDYGLRQDYFNPYPCGGLAVPEVRSLLEGLAQAAARLMLRRAAVGVRYFFDTFVPKLPAKRPSRRGGNGPTAFHQDFITFALDRSGGMQFWIPLDRCGPEQGTMAFISGSHRLGVLGDYQTYGDRTIFDVWPELAEMPLVGPLHYEVGDVSVHDHLTVHGAGPNLGDRPRWALITSLVPGDARWTGAPPEAFDPAPLRPRDLLDEARFPLLVPPEGEP